MVLVDVRNAPDHLKKNKIQHALEIPQNELESRLSELPKDKIVVVLLGYLVQPCSQVSLNPDRKRVCRQRTLGRNSSLENNELTLG